MKRVILILLGVIIFSFYFVTNGNEISNDFYDTINEKFLSKDHLGEDKYIYNIFVEAQEESDKISDGIINDVVNHRKDIGNVSNDINILYNNVIDINERNNIKLGVLTKYIDSIMNSKNINEFINKSIIIENELGVDIFSRVSIDRDFMDNTKNIVYLYPVTFAFGSSADYFIDEDYMAYKAYIKRAIINLLEKYGKSKNDARFISNEIISFYTNISMMSKLSSSYDDVTSYYNIVGREELKDIYTKFDMIKYLSNKGLNENKYSLVDKGQYIAIDKYLSDEYLLVWKNVVLVKILSSYVSYLDMEYRDIVVDLNNSLTGTNEDKGLEDDALSLVGSVFSTDIDKVYESAVIKKSDKEYLKDLFLDIKKYFRLMLKDNSWLSNDTLEYALVKLDNMKVYVGMDYEYDNSTIDVVGDNLVDNIISINKNSFSNELERLKNNKKGYALSETQVNAYYNPMDNAVYIPSSVMFLVNEDNSYYEMLGTIGMIIAHEITHGFDYNGSKFDSNGNLKNWWNDTDRDSYTKLKNKVSDYYSGIEVINGKYINGDKTVNENIADMGALKVITGVAKEKGASNKELKIMYSSFAKFWRSQASDEYTKLLLLNDSHSPNKYRVNAVLSIIDEFYDVYNIYPWNDMYVANSNRVSVW